MVASQNAPRGPKKTLGPSIPFSAPGFVKLKERVTVSKATCDSSMRTGERNAKTISNKLVKESTGARY